MELSKAFFVYGLVDPRNGKVFYVGKGSTKNGLHGRLNDHVSKARNNKKGKNYSKIRKILALGKRPDVTILYENDSEIEVLINEKRIIKDYGMENLTNLTPGGETAPSGDFHWTRQHPEKVLRGENHPFTKDPSKAAWGIKNGRHTKPESYLSFKGETHPNAKLTEKQVDEIRSRYQSDTSLTAVKLGKEYNVTGSEIGYILSGKSRGRQKIKTRKGNSKLTDIEVIEIRRLKSSGISVNELSKTFNVSESLIYQTVSNTIHKDVL